jgi:hypothetical protein
MSDRQPDPECILVPFLLGKKFRFLSYGSGSGFTTAIKTSVSLHASLLDGFNFLAMTTPMSLSSSVAPSFGLDLNPDLKLTPGPIESRNCVDDFKVLVKTIPTFLLLPYQQNWLHILVSRAIFSSE